MNFILLTKKEKQMLMKDSGPTCIKYFGNLLFIIRDIYTVASGLDICVIHPMLRLVCIHTNGMIAVTV